MRTELPSGTVTFLFTDIEGSTRLLQELGDGYAAVLAKHTVSSVSDRRPRGTEVDTQGDSFFVAFSACRTRSRRPEIQEALQWAGCGSGSASTRGATVTAEGYVGVDLHRGARVMSAATAAKSCSRRRLARCSKARPRARPGQTPSEGPRRAGAAVSARLGLVSSAADARPDEPADRENRPWSDGELDELVALSPGSDSSR